MSVNDRSNNDRLHILRLTERRKNLPIIQRLHRSTVAQHFAAEFVLCFEPFSTLRRVKLTETIELHSVTKWNVIICGKKTPCSADTLYTLILYVTCTVFYRDVTNPALAEIRSFFEFTRKLHDVHKRRLEIDCLIVFFVYI